MISACGAISGYKPTIEQGNIYTSEDIERLSIGMSKAQCAYILGNPILDSVYKNNRWNYVYTLKPRGSNLTYKKYAILYFDEQDNLTDIKLSNKPASSAAESKNSDNLHKSLAP